MVKVSILSSSVIAIPMPIATGDNSIALTNSVTAADIFSGNGGGTTQSPRAREAAWGHHEACWLQLTLVSNTPMICRVAVCGRISPSVPEPDTDVWWLSTLLWAGSFT